MNVREGVTRVVLEGEWCVTRQSAAPMQMGVHQVSIHRGHDLPEA